MKTFHKGGVHPNDHKLNADAPAQILTYDGPLCIMVSQHLGAPSVPIVKRGDKVKRGQPLTENTAFVGSVVHAPVSGLIQNVSEAPDTGNFARPAIFIQPEGDESEDFIVDDPTLDREIRLSPGEIIERIKAMGVVGLGGACFPTHVKLSIPKDCKAEYLLINGVECEPFLTDDYRLMLDKPDEILVGIHILMKALSVQKAIIGIEANKPKAIALLKEKAAAYTGITVEALKMKYPQGAEKQLVKALTGREVPSGKLPVHAGCVIQNVGTCFAVYEAVQKHKPLTERLVTVTGPCVASPRNFWVKIGTPVSALVEACGGLPENTGKIVAGGPMMGKALPFRPAVAAGRTGAPPRRRTLHPLRQMRGSLPDGTGTLSATRRRPQPTHGLVRTAPYHRLHRMRLLSIHLPLVPAVAGHAPPRQVKSQSNH